MQQVTAHASNVTSLTLTPSTNISTGNRLVVEVGVWSSSGATAASVTDSAGNTYVELLHFKASDETEMSVWTAPITAGGGTRPTITVKPTSKADVGAAVSEYSGLSTAADAAVVDQMAHASGTTSGAATVASGATPPTTAAERARASACTPTPGSATRSPPAPAGPSGRTSPRPPTSSCSPRTRCSDPPARPPTRPPAPAPAPSG